MAEVPATPIPQIHKLYIIDIDTGPIDIGKLCGRRHENRMKIELEPNAAGSLQIQIPPRGSPEADSNMVCKAC